MWVVGFLDNMGFVCGVVCGCGLWVLFVVLWVFFCGVVWEWSFVVLVFVIYGARVVVYALYISIVCFGFCCWCLKF